MQVGIGYKEVVICDMGIARVKQLTEATVTCDRRGAGTYRYMAPEMFTKSHRGPAADIYSLGCLYIELFGRKRVWPNLEGPEIMMRVLGSFNNPPQVPIALLISHQCLVIYVPRCALWRLCPVLTVKKFWWL